MMSFVFKMMNFVFKTDELCIYNDDFCMTKRFVSCADERIGNSKRGARDVGYSSFLVQVSSFLI